MGYAEVAGLSPVYGLYALLLPTVLYTLPRLVTPADRRALRVDLGARRRRDPAACGRRERPGGGARIGARAARRRLLPARLGRALGWLADYFSRPVLVGYIHGVAVVLVCSQLGKLLGVDIDASGPRPGRRSRPGARGRSGMTVLVERHRARHARRRTALPAAAAGLADRRRRLDLRLVGVRPPGARRRGRRGHPVGPAAHRRSRRRRSRRRRLVPAALGIFLVSFADGILTARAFAGKAISTFARTRSSSPSRASAPLPGSPRASRSGRAGRGRR